LFQIKETPAGPAQDEISGSSNRKGGVQLRMAGSIAKGGALMKSIRAFARWKLSSRR
jgi:hypothetical protein